MLKLIRCVSVFGLITIVLMIDWLFILVLVLYQILIKVTILSLIKSFPIIVIFILFHHLITLTLLSFNLIIAIWPKWILNIIPLHTHIHIHFYNISITLFTLHLHRLIITQIRVLHILLLIMLINIRQWRHY